MELFSGAARYLWWGPYSMEYLLRNTWRAVVTPTILYCLRDYFSSLECFSSQTIHISVYSQSIDIFIYVICFDCICLPIPPSLSFSLFLWKISLPSFFIPTQGWIMHLHKIQDPQMRENICRLSFWGWLIPFNRIISSCIHFFPANDIIFLWLNKIPLCTPTLFSVSIHLMVGVFVTFLPQWPRQLVEERVWPWWQGTW